MKRVLAIVLGLSCVTSACTTGSQSGPEHGGSAAVESGNGGASGTTGGSGGTAGTGGQGGTAGNGGQSGAAGTTGGSGGTAGNTPVDAGTDAMPQGDGAIDGGTHQPLAAQVCPAGPFGEPLPPEGMRDATMVVSGFVFVEGPLWLADQGVLLFSNMNGGASAGMGPPAIIQKLTPPSTVTVFQQNGNSNGLALDLEGNVLACTHDLQTLSRYDAVTADRTTLTDLRYMTKHFNSPNDLTVRSDGTVYFTDPDWQRDGRDAIGDTNVYRLTPAGAVELVVSGLMRPNGIALSPDEGTLYVGSQGSDIVSFTVAADGSTTPNGTFASAGGGTDGFTVDCAGNLYATGGNRVQVWNAAGDALGQVNVPKDTTNVAFGGSDRKTLYITAQDTVYSIVLNVPGLPY